MFSKRIIILLKFFDMCGFQTETSKFTGSRKNTVKIFLAHNILALTLTCFVFAHSMRPLLQNETLPYMVNEIYQIINGMFTYWIIIVESYVRRRTQQQFWHVYEYIEKHCRKCKQFVSRSYNIKFVEYFSVVTTIQIIFLTYFTHYVGNYFLFRIAYLFSQIMYQYRVFYYLFYLELIKFDLETIKNELKRIVAVSQQSCGFDGYECSATNLKRINSYYQLICELNKHINHIFGWSNVLTVLYCFHLPLTDGNWATWELEERSNVYIAGENFALSQMKFEFIVFIVRILS